MADHKIYYDAVRLYMNKHDYSDYGAYQAEMARRHPDTSPGEFETIWNSIDAFYDLYSERLHR